MKLGNKNMDMILVGSAGGNVFTPPQPNKLTQAVYALLEIVKDTYTDRSSFEKNGQTIYHCTHVTDTDRAMAAEERKNNGLLSLRATNQAKSALR